MRRKLSEEGKRLLRHALTHEDLEDEEDTRGAEHTSVDYSVVTNVDDSSAESDLEGFSEWQQGGILANGKKKKGGRRGKLREQLEGDETHDELEEALEKLAEKRDTTKIQALQKILTILRSAVLTNRLHGSLATSVTSQVLLTLKKRMTESGTLSLRALGVLAVTLGPDEQAFYDELVQPLQRLLMDQTETALRIEAAYALSIACTVCCREEQQKWELVDVLGGLLVGAHDAEESGDSEGELPDELLTTVMECWAFLISAFSPNTIVARLRDPDAIISDHVDALAGFVRDRVDPLVRSAACEVLALLIQLKYTTTKTTWTYEMEDPDGPLGGLDVKIARYMRESAKCIGKKNRKVQRSMLKEVLETLHSGEGPHSDLQIEGETLSITTWSRYFQANVLRRALQSGFQIHLYENPVLRDVFEVSDKSDAKERMIPIVRRRADHRSKAIHRRNDISRKDAVQNAFLYDG
ncbi:hypothetical protein Poli38472_012749 [Pythium oligandrum]|uniref:Interferon-related developmental regulator N-terminal domain-containing protein n=1 Tax=Pythium oligandrum TaxID=41045 RepID=A0A8K1FKB1_PYTOL|nr:hypothetical protein Poli38472_012749 [Pythium oligandrum]|eukprot:TMW61558.1 hypothetical protein Poli38472_012749 [Pythium oligandrum]